MRISCEAFGGKESEQNPSGLLVAEYWGRAIEGEKRDWVLQQAMLTGK